jgi:hypothetical protein
VLGGPWDMVVIPFPCYPLASDNKCDQQQEPKTGLFLKSERDEVNTHSSDLSS